MALSKVEASEGRLEALWIKWAKIAITGLVGSMVYGVSIIILALREGAILFTEQRSGCIRGGRPGSQNGNRG